MKRWMALLLLLAVPAAMADACDEFEANAQASAKTCSAACCERS